MKVKLNDHIHFFIHIWQYYGMTDPEIRGKMVAVKQSPDSDEWVEVPNHIDISEIAKIVDAARFEYKGEKDRNNVVILLHLLANLYYGDQYERANNKIESSVSAGIDRRFSNIRKDALNIYIEFAEYEERKLAAEAAMASWEMRWRERPEIRARYESRKKEIMKELEGDYGPIMGEGWKERLEHDTKEAEYRLEEEFLPMMRTEPEWTKLQKEVDKAGEVFFKFGASCRFPLTASSSWLKSLLQYHLFRWFIPDIHDVASARKELDGNPGRKSEDARFRTIANGTANLFYDYHLVKSRTQSNLLDFLVKLLKLMGITNNKGKFPTRGQIEDQIEYAPYSETPTRFFSQDLVMKEGLDHLKKRTFEDSEAALLWLDTPSQ